MDPNAQTYEEQEVDEATPFYKTKKFAVISILVLLVIIPILVMLVYSTNIFPNSQNTDIATTQKLTDLNERYKNIAKKEENATTQFVITGILSHIENNGNLTKMTIDIGNGVAKENYKNIQAVVEKTITFPKDLPVSVELTLTCKKTSNPCIVTDIKPLQAHQLKEFSDLPNLRVAASLNKWLTTQRDPKSHIYTIGSTCSLSGSCSESMVALSDGLVPLWGKYHYYKALLASDQADATTVQKEFTTDVENYNKFITAESGVQFQFLSCTYLFEIWKDTSVSQETRDLLAELCGLHYDIEKQPVIEISQYIGQMINILNTKNTTSSVYDDIYGYPLEAASARASHYAIRSLWKEEADLNPKIHVVEGAIELDSLDRAKKWFAEAIRIYKDNKSLFASSLCEVGTAAIDMFKATRDGRYLTFAETIPQKINFVDECTKENSKSQCNKSLYEATMCSDYIFRLYKITKKDSYLSTTKTIVNHLQENYFDEKGFPGSITNDGAFYNVLVSDVPEQAKMIKSTKTDSILLGLLSQLAILK